MSTTPTDNRNNHSLASEATGVILLSGNGSTCQAILDAQLPIQWRAVISDNPKAYGLKHAEKANLPSICLMDKNGNNAQNWQATLQEHLDRINPEFIILAGFMRILNERIVTQFAGRILNIHPALLPKYPGLHTHKKALDNRDKIHGSTVHFVTKQLDAGPIIAQARCTIEPTDTLEQLTEKVKQKEYQLYPLVIAWLLAHRIQQHNHSVLFDNRQLPANGVQVDLE